MRFLLCGVLFVIASRVMAQADSLDAVLRAWEAALNKTQSFKAKIERTTLDRALGANDTHTGFAMFVKADKTLGPRAYLHVGKAGNPDVYEMFICTGNDLREFVPANKVVRIHPMPKNKPGVLAQDNLMSFVFGIDVAKAKQRYTLKPDFSDMNYHMILIEPKTDESKGDFTLARISFRRKDYVLREIWFRQVNGTEITWSFNEAQVNVPIDAKFFQAVTPQGWRVDQAPAPAKSK